MQETEKHPENNRKIKKWIECGRNNPVGEKKKEVTSYSYALRAKADKSRLKNGAKYTIIAILICFVIGINVYLIFPLADTWFHSLIVYSLELIALYMICSAFGLRPAADFIASMIPRQNMNLNKDESNSGDIP